MKMHAIRVRSGVMVLLWLLAMVGVVVTPAVGQQTYQLDAQTQDWAATTTFDPDTPEGQIQLIRKTLAEGDARRSQRMARQWQRQYPNHPLFVEAKLLQADSKYERGNYYESLWDYEYIIRAYPGSEQFNVALEREFDIARAFLEGHRRKFLGMRLLTAYTEGAEIMIRIQERAPGSELGEQAILTLGDFYYQRGQMPAAVDAYDMFLLNYPRSIHRERVMMRLIQASLATFKGPEFDAGGLIEASERLRAFQAEFPAAAERMGVDALLVRIEESLALQTFRTARWFEQRGVRRSAIYLYQRTVDDHPRTAAAHAAIRRLAILGEPAILPDPDRAPGHPRERDPDEPLPDPEALLQDVDRMPGMGTGDDSRRRADEPFTVEEPRP